MFYCPGFSASMGRMRTGSIWPQTSTWIWPFMILLPLASKSFVPGHSTMCLRNRRQALTFRYLDPFIRRFTIVWHTGKDFGWRSCNYQRRCRRSATARQSSCGCREVRYQTYLQPYEQLEPWETTEQDCLEPSGECQGRVSSGLSLKWLRYVRR